MCSCWDLSILAAGAGSAHLQLASSSGDTTLGEKPGEPQPCGVTLSWMTALFLRERQPFQAFLRGSCSPSGITEQVLLFTMGLLCPLCHPLPHGCCCSILSPGQAQASPFPYLHTSRSSLTGEGIFRVFLSILWAVISFYHDLAEQGLLNPANPPTQTRPVLLIVNC